jgi:hypothetical protein
VPMVELLLEPLDIFVEPSEEPARATTHHEHAREAGRDECPGDRGGAPPVPCPVSRPMISPSFIDDSTNFAASAWPDPVIPVHLR